MFLFCVTDLKLIDQQKSKLMPDPEEWQSGIQECVSSEAFDRQAM